MASLSDEDRAAAIAILEELRGRIAAVAGEDRERLFQMRRYILKRLEFDERGTPTQRRKLKDAKRKSQHGLCALVPGPIAGARSGVGSISGDRWVYCKKYAVGVP